MKTKRLISLLLVVVMLAGTVVFVGASPEVPTVESVTAQLEAIDTLQQMQDNRSKYTASGNYDITTTDPATIDSHLKAHEGYESYISDMFAARLAAKNAYEALSPEDQAQIDPALVAKLDEELPTSFSNITAPVTPADDEYIYEVVKYSKGFGYEIGNHAVGGEIPQTFVMVDTSDGKTSWTPDGPYVYGESNYDVTYCCDYDMMVQWGTDYKRVNLEDSTYYSKAQADKIRAIVTSSYPYLTVDEMKANLIEGGLSEKFVNSLTRADIISAVQMSIWNYSNTELIDPNNAGYCGTVSATKNSGIRWFTVLHDYTSELWDWLPAGGQKTYDDSAAFRVNNLIHYLCSLEGIEAPEGSVVISDMKIGRVDLIPNTDDLYNVGLHVMLNEGCDAKDDVSLKVTSYSEDGKITSTKSIKVGTSKEYTLTINAKVGDTIKVTAEGTQHVDKSVYFYESEFGQKNAGSTKGSQSMLSVAEGYTPVCVSEEFTFERDIEKGLRIYKKSSEDKSPISDIKFDIYKVETEDGEVLNETPTKEEIAKYATDENLVGSVITDVTGYAALELPDDGTYLIIEEHNKDKVVKPADPFYITIPWAVEKKVEGDNGEEIVIEYLDIVSLYPKNTPITPPPPPPPPPPEDIYGYFEIIKHDSDNADKLLEGAEFSIYRAATENDPEDSIETLNCNGLEIAVVPVYIDGEALVLVTDENGSARTPKLDVGVYYIKETKAPKGYVLPEEAYSVTVVSQAVKEVTYTYVANDRGIRLPETGGMGTTIFVTIGVTLALSAAVLLVTKKRVSNR